MNYVGTPHALRWPASTSLYSYS